MSSRSESSLTAIQSGSDDDDTPAYDTTSGCAGGTNSFQNSDDEVDADPEAGQSDEDGIGREASLEPVLLGRKRKLDTKTEDTVMPKVKKGIDGSGQRLKASDFDDITKEILATAVSIFRCLIVTQAPFPDSVFIETKLAKQAWHEACNTKGINVRLTPALMKMVRDLIPLFS
jgi:hypothetical protein